jgi:hypothetical protein
MTDSITTTDLSEFGNRELEEMEVLLRARRKEGFPDDFDDDGIKIMFNKNSGNVFFTNEDCQVAMMNGDKLESFYSCPECGNEGFDDKEEYPFKKYDGYCSKECADKNK